MVANIAVESVVGIVPILGDLFDFAFKANERNLELFESARLVHPSRGAGGRILLSIALVILVLLTVIGASLILGLYFALEVIRML